MSQAQINANAPGAILFGVGEIELNAGRPVTTVEVTNTGDRAIQVGSHFHFFEVNRALQFDRAATFGHRLDIPSGTSVRFEAGQAHAVRLVPFGGARRIAGFANLALTETRESALERARTQGYLPGETF